MPFVGHGQEWMCRDEPGRPDLGNQIAEHLHDTAIQSLALANIKLAAVADALQDSGLRAAADQLKEARALIVRGMGECRSFMTDLRPRSPGWAGWQSAMAEYVEQLQTTFPVAIEMAEDGDFAPLPMPASAQEALFRATRELVFNACKHGQPAFIGISWRHTKDCFQVRVKDDGKGFDPRRPAPGVALERPTGFGLMNVQERIRALGGRMVVQSAPGHGADILVSIPCRRKEEEGWDRREEDLFSNQV